jgi:hypothetical protein
MPHEAKSALCEAIRELGAEPAEIMDALVAQRAQTFTYFSLFDDGDEIRHVGNLVTQLSLIIAEISRGTGRKEPKHG